jgi:hypothetical protein
MGGFSSSEFQLLTILRNVLKRAIQRRVVCISISSSGPERVVELNEHSSLKSLKRWHYIFKLFVSLSVCIGETSLVSLRTIILFCRVKAIVLS